ncbi:MULTISPECIES: LysR family transcriptional regulator [unclassified Caulobacter]|uniref:LysR family transcriptional regulator n=1 Tax=unclassified Caulobacter TaxID=2648921 RepID=UPI000D33258B|nr:MULTISPECIES: LysR family transcriptional regulator [unclassified Caulobacter]PTS89595.1 LysR family transcriptional regulator [Caulobacter sp. HMWF009]PTT06341.1 LysR family transcriptional regulator [Caulobacter sp. HMWF025]PTT80024.1 LysR family transcriptional regulator [Pseudomonas sp. HMWF010]
MDHLDSLRVFISVSTHGSFAEAARRLRLSPSVVTRAIADLERRLGLVLLHRTTRSVRLTERGEIYLASSRRILADIETADAEVRGANAAPRGLLNITAPILFGRLHVLPIVSQTLKQHSELTIRLSLSDRYVHLADEGVDLAIRIGPLADSSLMATRLGNVNRVLVASPAYLETRGLPQSPGDLIDHDVVAFENVDATNEWRFDTDRKTVRVSPRLMVNSADAAIAAAEDGLGITRALSYQVRESVLAGRLVLLLADRMPERLPVNAVFPARRLNSANLNAFLDAARTRFKTHPLNAMTG